MVDEVGARLSVANRLGFSRDMRASERDVAGLGREISSTSRRAGLASKTLGLMGAAGRGVGRTFSGAVAPSRSFALSLGIGAGGVALAARRGWQELTELNKVEQITKARLESTNRVAGVSAGYIRKRSMALEDLTTIDENLIGSGQNLLLTFKNIRNEAGRGNKIFDRGTMSALNLSQEFGSVESASKMMGKALNDPIYGMTALSRAGVTFSEEQKTAVERMMESNDILGAQKLILREVESQVGGTAAAYGDSVEGMGNRVTDAFGDVSRALVTGFVPLVERYAKPFTDWLGDVANIVERRGWRGAWEEVVPEELRDNVGSIAGALTGALIPAIGAFTLKIGIASMKLAPFLLLGSALADMFGVQVEKSDQLSDSMKKRLGPGLGEATEKLGALMREVNQWSPGAKGAAGLGILLGPGIARGLFSGRGGGALAGGAMAAGGLAATGGTSTWERGVRSAGRGAILTALLAPLMPPLGRWLGDRSRIGNGQRAGEAIFENQLTDLGKGQQLAGAILRGNTDAVIEYKAKMLELAAAEKDQEKRQLILDKRLQITRYAFDLVTNELRGQTDHFSHLTREMSQHEQQLALSYIEAGNFLAVMDLTNGTLREHVRWLKNAQTGTENLAEAEADWNLKSGRPHLSEPSGGGGGKGGKKPSDGGTPPGPRPERTVPRTTTPIPISIDGRELFTIFVESVGDITARS